MGRAISLCSLSPRQRPEVRPREREEGVRRQDLPLLLGATPSPRAADAGWDDQICLTSGESGTPAQPRVRFPGTSGGPSPPPLPARPLTPVLLCPPDSRPVLALHGARGPAGPWRLRGRCAVRARSPRTKAVAEGSQARPAPRTAPRGSALHRPTSYMPGVPSAPPTSRSSRTRRAPLPALPLRRGYPAGPALQARSWVSTLRVTGGSTAVNCVFSQTPSHQCPGRALSRESRRSPYLAGPAWVTRSPPLPQRPHLREGS